MQRLFPLLTLLLLFSLCTCDRAPETTALKVTTFFDLNGYMNAEIERLTEGKVKADKSITLNGKTERKEETDINYANDLRVFREADINKPAWTEKYATDEQKLSGSHKITTYTTLDSNLVVQQLVIEEDQGVPVKIEIDRKTGTVLSNGRHELVYQPGKGYSVTTIQDNKFGDDVDAVISVVW
jgi:hypothetical protein